MPASELRPAAPGAAPPDGLRQAVDGLVELRARAEHLQRHSWGSGADLLHVELEGVVATAGALADLVAATVCTFLSDPGPAERGVAPRHLLGEPPRGPLTGVRTRLHAVLALAATTGSLTEAWRQVERADPASADALALGILALNGHGWTLAAGLDAIPSAVPRPATRRTPRQRSARRASPA